jgi:glutathione synthase/RimK-type ligase-like ATP-grasp enzyme
MPSLLNFVLIANPETRRVELFQQALANLGLPSAVVIPYAELLAGQHHLGQWQAPDTWVRFEAPERNFAVTRELIAAGADLGTENHHIQNHQAIRAIDARQLPDDLGRIYYPRQWYLGWRHWLQRWQEQLQVPSLNAPEDIAIMFDKPQCQQRLQQRGIPIPHGLGAIHDYEHLRTTMRQQDYERIFVKLANGSAASGVVAYELRQGQERAITTMERVVEAGELRFYNSRKIRQYRHSGDIADMLNFLLAETAQIEAWQPKAKLASREFDLRVVVIGGHARQAVMRLGNSPITNLHLGNERRPINDLPPGLTATAWQTMLHTCEQAAACFPHSFYCGIDLLMAPNLQDHCILELNAFGDLLQGITWQGQDTYTTQITMLAEQTREA